MKFLVQLLLIGTTLFLGACKLNPQNLEQNGSLLDTNRCVKSNTGLYYSHLADPASQEEVKTALLEAGISEQNIQKFFAQVTHFNQLVGKEYLITSGFVHTDSLSPAYDIEQIISNWQEKSPFFIGYNCRITAFSLMKDNIHIAHPEQANARELFMDKDALATSPETLLNTQEQQAFESFYSLVPTITTKDPAVHSSKIKQSRAEKGISFQTSPASLISVWFHSHLEGEEDYLFIGHIGVLIQRKHDLLFIEKLAFDEPYQASIFSTRTELAHYLRAKYDTAYNQPTASPLLRENDKLLDETCRTTNQTWRKENKQPLPPLNFTLLTWNRKHLEIEVASQAYPYLERFHNNEQLQTRKQLTFNRIAQEIKNTEYHIEYSKHLGDLSLGGYGVSSYPWKWYHQGKLIWTGDDIVKFEHTDGHFLLCSWKNGFYCFIDGNYEYIGHPFDSQKSLPLIYQGAIYQVKLLPQSWEMFERYGVFKDQELLYSFEAEFPTDNAIMQFFVDESGRRLQYRTLLRKKGADGPEWTKMYLIHNGEDLAATHGREEVIWLGKIADHTVFLYKKDKKIWYHFAGQERETPFSEIAHDECCEAGFFNLSFVDEGILLYGKKEERYGLRRAKLTQ